MFSNGERDLALVRRLGAMPERWQTYAARPRLTGCFMTGDEKAPAEFVSVRSEGVSRYVVTSGHGVGAAARRFRRYGSAAGMSLWGVRCERYCAQDVFPSLR